MRWISSMNSTSPGTRLDSRAARSPACWMAGPLDMRSGRLLSWATIIASVVLPSPGGPASRMWSGVRFCIAAASSSSCSWPRTFTCPTNSARLRGRRAPSNASSFSSSATSGLRRRRRRRRRSRPHPRTQRARARAAAARRPSPVRRRSPRRRPRRPRRRPPARSSPRPTSAVTTFCVIEPVAARPVTPDAAAGASSLPCSETAISFAVFGPMPDTLRKGASSSAATARAMSSGLSVASTPRADFGPTPETPRNRSKTSSSARVSKPNRLRSSSRTMSAVCRLASCPSRRVSACCGVICTREPDSPDLDDDDRPRDREHGAPNRGDHRATRSAAAHAACAFASAGGRARGCAACIETTTPPRMADRERESVGGVGRFRHSIQTQNPRDHRTDLRLLGRTVPGDRRPSPRSGCAVRRRGRARRRAPARCRSPGPCP